MDQELLGLRNVDASQAVAVEARSSETLDGSVHGAAGNRRLLGEPTHCPRRVGVDQFQQEQHDVLAVEHLKSIAAVPSPETWDTGSL